MDHRWDVYLLSLCLEIASGYITTYVIHGQCDTTVSFPPLFFQQYQIIQTGSRNPVNNQHCTAEVTTLWQYRIIILYTVVIDVFYYFTIYRSMNFCNKHIICPESLQGGWKLNPWALDSNCNVPTITSLIPPYLLNHRIIGIILTALTTTKMTVIIVIIIVIVIIIIIFL